MSELLGSAQGRIEQLLARLDTLRSEHEGVLEREAGHLESRRDALVGEIRTQVEEDVRQPVASAVETVTDTLQALGDALRDAGGRVGTVREALDAGLDSVREEMDPLGGGIEQVKEAARQVGLDFA